MGLLAARGRDRTHANTVGPGGRAAYKQRWDPTAGGSGAGLMRSRLLAGGLLCRPGRTACRRLAGRRQESLQLPAGRLAWLEMTLALLAPDQVASRLVSPAHGKAHNLSLAALILADPIGFSGPDDGWGCGAREPGSGTGSPVTCIGCEHNTDDQYWLAREGEAKEREKKNGDLASGSECPGQCRHPPACTHAVRPSPAVAAWFRSPTTFPEPGARASVAPSWVDEGSVARSRSPVRPR